MLTLITLDLIRKMNSLDLNEKRGRQKFLRRHTGDKNIAKNHEFLEVKERKNKTRRRENSEGSSDEVGYLLERLGKKFYGRSNSHNRTVNRERDPFAANHNKVQKGHNKGGLKSCTDREKGESDEESDRSGDYNGIHKSYKLSSSSTNFEAPIENKTLSHRPVKLPTEKYSGNGPLDVFS